MSPPDPLAGRGAARAPAARTAAPRAARPGLVVPILVLLAAAAAGLQYAHGRTYAARRVAQPVLYVPSGVALQRLALSFDSALADLYWMRAVQHYGRTRRSDAAGRYELLQPLLEIVTTLDPRFDIAYRLGAILLAEAHPHGPGRPDQAVALLEKGLRARPGRWQYLHDIGFVHYWWLQDYETAAHWFERASEAPGAPWWLRSLAAETLARGGDRLGSRALWRQVHRTADNPWLRAEAERRLLQLDALDEIDAYTAAVDRFARRAGRPPSAWAELLPGGAGEPLDPAGHPYALQRGAGVVSVAPASPLYPLPAGPGATAPP